MKFTARCGIKVIKMKKSAKVVGMLTIFVALGVFFAGCAGAGSDENEDSPQISKSCFPAKIFYATNGQQLSYERLNGSFQNTSQYQHSSLVYGSYQTDYSLSLMDVLAVGVVLAHDEQKAQEAIQSILQEDFIGSIETGIINGITVYKLRGPDRYNILRNTRLWAEGNIIKSVQMEAFLYIADESELLDGVVEQLIGCDSIELA